MIIQTDKERMMFETALNKANLNIEIKQIINSALESYDYTRNHITLNMILNAVSIATNIPVLKIKLNTRKREVVAARQISHYFSAKLTNYSLEQIGNLIGKKDHSTVIHSIRTIEKFIGINERSTVKIVNNVERILLSKGSEFKRQRTRRKMVNYKLNKAA